MNKLTTSLTLLRPMEFLIKFDTFQVRIAHYIYNGVTGYTFPKHVGYQSLKIYFVLAKCVEPDEVLHSVTDCYVTLDILAPKPGQVAQSVTCLATDGSLTADPGVVGLIPARSHTFVEIDLEIISMVILLPSAESFKKDYCQLQAKVCAQITG